MSGSGRPRRGRPVRGWPRHPDSPSPDGDRRDDADPLNRLVIDGILYGSVTAGVGFVFVLVFLVSNAVWGSYLGANPNFGLSLSFGVMTFGVAVATLLWLGREIVLATGSGIGRVRSSR